jgi:hypothetical protein
MEGAPTGGGVVRCAYMDSINMQVLYVKVFNS